MVATMEPAARFGELIKGEALRRAWEQTEVKVVVGDGAEWIWNLADEHFPDAIHVVDLFLFHSKERLSELARLLFRGDEMEAWRKAALDEPAAGDAGSLLDRLRAVDTTRLAKEKAKELGRAVHYFTVNRERMHYAEFRASGLLVGPGWSRLAARRSWPHVLSSRGCAGRSAGPVQSSPCGRHRLGGARSGSGLTDTARTTRLAYRNDAHPPIPALACISFSPVIRISPPRSGWPPHLDSLASDVGEYAVQRPGHVGEIECVYEQRCCLDLAAAVRAQEAAELLRVGPSPPRGLLRSRSRGVLRGRGAASGSFPGCP